MPTGNKTATASLALPVNQRISLTVVMPMYNEQSNIESAVSRTVESCEGLTDEFEIIVVDDGSTDATGRIADQLASEDPRIRALHHPRVLSYGIALQTGFNAANCNWILHNPADLPLAPEDIEKFLEHFSDADVIVARRVSRRAHSTWRRITSWTNNMLLRMLFAPRTTDLNFVQFYRRSFIEGLELKSTSPAFVTPELILCAERTGKNVVEVEAEFQKRTAGEPKFNIPYVILWTLRDMFAFRLRTLFRGWDT